MTANDIQFYYNQGREHDRLLRERGQVELARTQDIVQRYLPAQPVTILDIGGGAGIYALWLAQLGHRVHLVDMMPLHIEQAQQSSARQPDFPLASARLGDARQLDFPDAVADVVLLFGPLYHLTERAERLQALREAYRVLRPGGILLAATISRFASLLDALFRDYLGDAYFIELVEADLVDGQHRNPRQQPGYFATAYFHHPAEIQAEVAEAGFEPEVTLAIEGPANFIPDFDKHWADAAARERLLRLLRTVESEPTMLGATGHLLTVGRKG